MSADHDGETMLKTLGLQRVISMENGRAALEFEVGEHMCHSGGIAQGGFVTGWIDAAMAHAALSMPREDIAAMSLEVKVAFYAPARPGLVVAEGWMDRTGGSICFAEGRLVDAAGTVLARATSTMRIMSQSRVEASSRAARAAKD